MANAADLPLNERGAVYHLDLLSEEIADTIITVGDPARVNQVSRHFDSIELKRQHREFVTHTGYLNNQRLTVLSTGIGMPNIDIVINELDALASMDLPSRTYLDNGRQLSLIRLGTTGSIHENFAIGDIINSAYAIGLDNMMDFYQYSMTNDEKLLHQNCQKTFTDYTSAYFVAQAESSLHQQFKNDAKPGITITCNGFYAAQGRALRHPLAFPNLYRDLSTLSFQDIPVTNIEMETAALYGLSRLMGHRCVSLSVVLANRIKGEFADAIEPLVERMIKHALIEITENL
ncbi:nucleoside phosphorylase [Legionella sp. W05-934-2]|jgi:uridine phosphorylase|uniref:nucleoside phosphorylase n=1 Tax=Legionella sp. W05-934-2 TaxID=1198649 RepID=UPI0034631B7F